MKAVPPFYTVAQIARKLRRTTARVYQLIKERELPTVRVGEFLLVPVEPWEAWLAKRERAQRNAQQPPAA
jgi:excisionase family DNA binding protein